MDPELLEKICCPETRQPLRLADTELLAKLRGQLQSPTGLTNRGGRLVQGPLDGALIREDNRYLYPIVDGIPILLIEEAIDLESLSVAQFP